MHFGKNPCGITAKVFLYLLVLVSLPALAEIRFGDSRTWRRAQVLPVGQKIWSFQSSYQNISERFSAGGRVQPLGESYARAVTWNQLRDAEEEGQADIESYMQENRLSGEEVAATSTYEVRRQELNFGINWAYGLTSRWTMIVKIPIFLRTTQVHQDIEMTPELARGVGTSSDNSLLSLKGKELRQRVRQMAEAQLTASGYDEVPERSQTWDFGDINLMSQVALAKSYRWEWATQQIVRFPTAQNQSVSDYIQGSEDRGPVALGMSSLLDYKMRRWLIGARVGYLHQLPDSTRLRIPNQDRSSPGEVNPKVGRTLGAWNWAAIDTEYQVSRDLDFNLEYSYMTKFKDRYRADQMTDAQASDLSEGTNQQLHQSRVGLLYRLSDEYSRNGVVSQWVATVDYTFPWQGQNSLNSARTSFELINYF